LYEKNVKSWKLLLFSCYIEEKEQTTNKWWTTQVKHLHKEGKIPYARPQKSYLFCLYRTVAITENKSLPNGHLLVHSELEKSYCSVCLQVNKIGPNIKYKHEVAQT